MHDLDSQEIEVYRHTQRSPLFLILILFAGVMGVLAWRTKDESVALGILVLLAGLFVALAFSFYSLTTSVRADRLVIRYGPIPLFGTSLDLIEVDEVSVDSTTLIDGWGIHYVPFRGWTFNLWGFRCVKIEMGNRVYRVGTDDAENLAAQIIEHCKSIKDDSV